MWLESLIKAKTFSEGRSAIVELKALLSPKFAEEELEDEEETGDTELDLLTQEIENNDKLISANLDSLIFKVTSLQKKSEELNRNDNIILKNLFETLLNKAASIRSEDANSLRQAIERKYLVNSNVLKNLQKHLESGFELLEDKIKQLKDRYVSKAKLEVPGIKPLIPYQIPDVIELSDDGLNDLRRDLNFKIQSLREAQNHVITILKSDIGTNLEPITATHKMFKDIDDLVYNHITEPLKKYKEERSFVKRMIEWAHDSIRLAFGSNALSTRATLKNVASTLSQLFTISKKKVGVIEQDKKVDTKRKSKNKTKKTVRFNIP